MSRLLELLLLLLRPAAEAPGDSPAEPSAADDPPADEPEIEGEPSPEEPQPADDPAARLAAELAAEKEGRARDRERADRYEREMADARARQAKPAVNEEWEREEAILRDPNSTAEQKWTVGANRRIRQTEALAQQSYAQSYDMSDKAAFSALCLSDPMAKRYETRVEEELKRARAAGQNPSREAVYTYMIGNDTREARKKKAAQSAPVVNRGKTPGVKSDVSGRGAALTEHQKRVQRLENQQI
jgi:hypothetical protein